MPQITPFSFGEDDDINLDEPVAVTCILTKGDSPINIWWTLVDDYSPERNLSTNDGVMITRNNQKVSLLTIESVKARHRGNYTCYARNKAGITHFSAFLAISGDLFVSIISLNIQNFAICFLNSCCLVKFFPKSCRFPLVMKR